MKRKMMVMMERMIMWLKVRLTFRVRLSFFDREDESVDG